MIKRDSMKKRSKANVFGHERHQLQKKPEEPKDAWSEFKQLNNEIDNTEKYEEQNKTIKYLGAHQSHL